MAKRRKKERLTPELRERIRQQALERQEKRSALPVLVIASDWDDFLGHCFARGLLRQKTVYVRAPEDLEGFKPGKCLVQYTA